MDQYVSWGLSKDEMNLDTIWRGLKIFVRWLMIQIYKISQGGQVITPLTQDKFFYATVTLMIFGRNYFIEVVLIFSKFILRMNTAYSDLHLSR